MQCSTKFQWRNKLKFFKQKLQILLNKRFFSSHLIPCCLHMLFGSLPTWYQGWLNIETMFIMTLDQPWFNPDCAYANYNVGLTCHEVESKIFQRYVPAARLNQVESTLIRCWLDVVFLLGIFSSFIFDNFEYISCKIFIFISFFYRKMEQKEGVNSRKSIRKLEITPCTDLRKIRTGI